MHVCTPTYEQIRISVLHTHIYTHAHTAATAWKSDSKAWVSDSSKKRTRERVKHPFQSPKASKRSTPPKRFDVPAPAPAPAPLTPPSRLHLPSLKKEESHENENKNMLNARPTSAQHPDKSFASKIKRARSFKFLRNDPVPKPDQLSARLPKTRSRESILGGLFRRATTTTSTSTSSQETHSRVQAFR